MLDKIKFSECMLGLGELYDKQITEFVADTYYEILKNYEYPEVNKAVMNCVKTHKYNTLPKPADILEYLEGSPTDKALIAWLKAKEAVRKGGYIANIEFDDPIISHCLTEIGGWQWFCNVLIDELPFVEKRFKDLYNTLSKREITEPIKITGFIENTNQEIGFSGAESPSVKIGFKDNKQLGLADKKGT